MVVWRLRIFKLTRRGAVAALAPAAVVLYLFSYTYLGASRGVAIFNFLLNTALGNLVLSLVAAFYAYNIAKSIATPLCSRITELESPLLEDLHLLVLVPALSTTIYPV
ncbi:MAG: hypothetical protein RMH84_05375, partial [Sulfolobales archaeon]|nr:hypothetical protein [Sulfolobales archaeon]